MCHSPRSTSNLLAVGQHICSRNVSPLGFGTYVGHCYQNLVDEAPPHENAHQHRWHPQLINLNNRVPCVTKNVRKSCWQKWPLTMLYSFFNSLSTQSSTARRLRISFIWCWPYFAVKYFLLSSSSFVSSWKPTLVCRFGGECLPEHTVVGPDMLFYENSTVTQLHVHVALPLPCLCACLLPLGNLCILYL